MLLLKNVIKYKIPKNHKNDFIFFISQLDSKLTNPWSNTINNNPSIISSSLQSNTATIYNTNKLPPVIVNRKSTSKCFLCKKKTGLATTYQCRYEIQ